MDERQQKARSALAELGMQAAEIRTLSAQLAGAAARQDFDTACDLAEAVLVYFSDFRELYTQLLVIGVPARLQERTSV